MAEYRVEKGANGRNKIITTDDVGFDEEIFHNLFDDGVCDTYVELPRMLKQIAIDINSDCDLNDKLIKDIVIYHIDGLRQVKMAAEEAIEKLIKLGTLLCIPLPNMYTDDMQNIDIHLDGKDINEPPDFGTSRR